MNEELIYRYFPDLDVRQKERFALLMPLYSQWNCQINVISRKDLDQLYLRHVLHSLALARTLSEPFRIGNRILDVGTGGGFPGIPLAILYPQTYFTLCDSIAKKIKVVTAVSQALQLDNVTCVSARCESLKGQLFDAVVSRAVAPLEELIPWVRPLLKKEAPVLCLKGGNLIEEITRAAQHCRLPKDHFSVLDLDNVFPGLEDDFFCTKKICEIKQSSYLCAPQKIRN